MIFRPRWGLQDAISSPHSPAKSVAAMWGPLLLLEQEVGGVDHPAAEGVAEDGDDGDAYRLPAPLSCQREVDIR